MIENRIITDHYNNTYYDHKVAIFPIIIDKKNCFFNDQCVVIFTDPNEISLFEIYDFLNQKFKETK